MATLAQRRDTMALKGMYLLRLMQFNEHLSGFTVCQSCTTDPSPC
jgi:hypothetical protein